MRIALSDEADSDLQRIYRYLSERSPLAADTFIERIDANLKNLSRFPFIGRERSSLEVGLRGLIVGVHPYLLFRRNRAENNCTCDRRPHGR